jgi:hypothetical protein
MVIRINVPTAAHRTDFDCEVLEVKKVKRNENLQYAITIQEPPVSGRSGRSTRHFQPRDKVQVVRHEYPTLLRHWSGIAWYGAIFSDEDDARLWAKAEARGGRWEVGPWNGVGSGEWQAKVHH